MERSAQKVTVKLGNLSVQRNAEQWVIDEFNKGRNVSARIKPPAAIPNDPSWSAGNGCREPECRPESTQSGLQ